MSNDKQEHQRLYELYMASLEKRMLNNRGIFLRFDLSDGLLLRLRQYAVDRMHFEPAVSLPELMDQFDEFRIFSYSGERFRDVFSKERQLTAFHAGRRDAISHWSYKKQDGQTMELEMVTILASNPANDHIEAILQLYARDNESEPLGEKHARQILFIQKPSPQRETLLLALAPHFMIKTADTVAQGALMLEQGHSFDMILLDSVSGDDEIFDFIRKVKGNFASTPLLVLTDGSIDQEIAVLKLGVADIQSIPIDSTLLLHRMTNLLTRQDMVKAIQCGTEHRDEISDFLLRPAFLLLVNELIHTSPSGAYMMVCFDVTDFKLINARYGYEQGDHLLRRLSDALRHVTKNLMTAQTRAKADRFYVLLPNDEDLIDAFRKEYEEGIEYNLTVRFGLYPVTNRDEAVGDMMNKALLAMESLKETANQSIAWYQEEMMRSFLLNRQVIEDLPAALEEGQIIPWFQPKYDYANKRWCGAEALVRWEHPQLDLIPPDTFVPILENKGLITQVDLYILEQVCAYQRRWKDMGLMTLRVSVNLSQMDFLNDDIANIVLDILDRYGMTGADIRFEITETAYILNADNLKEFIRRTHHRGFLLDMDDFGSGYSSLNMLDELEVDAVKLDAQMTRKIGNGKRSDHVIGAIIRLAGWLKMDVLAEGVETEEQAAYLHSIGCAYMQGYYFSKPLPASDYEELLREQDVDLENPLPLNRVEYGLTLNNDMSIDIHDISAFLRIIGTIYPLIIAQNYSKNRYYIMEYDHFSTTSCSSGGNYDELIVQGASSFHPEDRESFSAAFRMETVLGAFERGISQLTHEGRQLGDDGMYRWIRTRVYLYRDDDGDLKGYTLSRNIEAEIANRERADGSV